LQEGQAIFFLLSGDDQGCRHEDAGRSLQKMLFSADTKRDETKQGARSSAMLFAIDIAQIIASGVAGATFQERIARYKSLGVTLPEAITNDAQLFSLPQIIPLHQEVPGAAMGVSLLATAGTISYYLIGRDGEAGRVQERQNAMSHWLCTKQFPSPANLITCASITDQLVRLSYQREQHTIVLIDTNVPLTLAIFAALSAGQNPDMKRKIQRHIADDLRRRLVLVAFGRRAAALPSEVYGVRLLALPGWNMATALLTALGINREH
jgi:hypothetical protein